MRGTAILPIAKSIGDRATREIRDGEHRTGRVHANEPIDPMKVRLRMQIVVPNSGSPTCLTMHRATFSVAFGLALAAQFALRKAPRTSGPVLSQRLSPE
jgi:hypothetical protein